MTLRHLAVFTAVIDNGCSVTKAAEELHVAQPSVSQTIAELEQYYNIKLFDRLNRHLYLTPEGKKLAGYARHLVGSFDELNEMMRTVSGSMPLRIGASLTTGTVLLPVLLRSNTDIAAEVFVFNTSVIEQMIIEGKIDIAVIEGKIQSSDILQIPLLQDELIFASSPLYRERKNPVFILRERGSGTRELSDGMITELSEKKQLYPIVWEIANTQTIIELVKAVQGITVISRKLIQHELEEGRFCELKSEGEGIRSSVTRMFRLVYHKDKYIDERMQQFINRCKAQDVFQQR